MPTRRRHGGSLAIILLVANYGCKSSLSYYFYSFGALFKCGYGAGENFKVG